MAHEYDWWIPYFYIDTLLLMWKLLKILFSFYFELIYFHILMQYYIRFVSFVWKKKFHVSKQFYRVHVLCKMIQEYPSL